MKGSGDVNSTCETKERGMRNVFNKRKMFRRLEG